MKRFAPEIITKAVNLRKSGHSLSEISGTINVSKNTVYHWVSNVKLTSRQKKRLHNKEVKCGKRGLQKARKIKQIKILKWKKDVLFRAEKYKGIVDKKSAFAALLCGVLYLCEGAKYPSSKQMIFGSSDPRLIQVFLCLLRANFVVDEKNFDVE